MAGIGFTLRRNLESSSYVGLLRAYAVAAVIGSGPWLISMGSMLFIGLYTEHLGRSQDVVTLFLGVVTHLMALSLIIAGLVQLVFVRFVADQLFAGRKEEVAPNTLGALGVTTALGVLVGVVEVWRFFPTTPAFAPLYVAALATLANVWVLAALMSGLKRYTAVLGTFAAGYGIIVFFGGRLGGHGVAGYLFAFFLGHCLMVVGMWILVLREYPSLSPPVFTFLKRGQAHYELAAVGALFNLAIWADKFVFWSNPVTSVALVGPIRYSIIYDVPIFVAYLSIIPGVSVFFVRIEVDFAAAYARYFAAVREGDTLGELQRLRNELVGAAKTGLYDILKIQGLTVATLLLLGRELLALFHIPDIYTYLFNVDVVGVAFQTLLLGIFTILFYLDYRRLVLMYCALFAASNTGLSLLTQWMGPRFYGFGFAVSAALTALLSLRGLAQRLDRLEYETFMR